MSFWISIIFAGLINYLTRLGSILIINPHKMSKDTKELLNYVPAAVFPAIIFPSVFIDDSGILLKFNDPKIISITLAFIIGIITKNLIITILSGLISFWTMLFLL